SRPRWAGLALGLAAVALVGCYRGADGDAADGDGDEDGTAGSADDDGSGGEGDTDAAGCAEAASVSPLRRLSEAQYRNTLRDLFAPSIDVAVAVADELDRIPVDDAGSTFRILDARVSEQHAQAYYRLADALASTVAYDETNLAAIAGECALAAVADEACIDAFLDDFGLRVYRRPLAAAEREHYHELAAAQLDGEQSFRSMVFSMLLTPQFLYHVEVEGDGDDTQFDLDGYELASRLSFHFWQTMPDAELFAAAADGSLVTDEGYLAQLDRVFGDPRTQITVDRFYDEWLQLGWLTVFPDTPAFATFAEGTTIGEPGADHIVAAQDEIHALARHFTFAEEGTLADLLLTDLSFTQSPHLAALYGVEPWDGVSELPRMPAGRGGLLTRVGFLLTGNHETHPVHRGSAVRRRIMCQELDAPNPADLPPGSLDPPPVTEDQTTRQRYEAKTADATCQGCHAQINPIGFVLEGYDAIGRARTEERVIDDATGEVLATLPIDSSATLAGSDASISTGLELSEQILASGGTEACFARQYFRATFGREEIEDDTCVIDRVSAVLVEGGSMREALRTIALDPVFRSRRVQ
ncbi:MAG TPA: DUF1588 domain-containing protein, partial [Nannocystaceae bacterium]|nr:DUF1588 domain-containing protein [Nannocystaceae bacterium]